MAERNRDAVAYLSLGANLGDRQETLRRAVHALDEHPRIRVDWPGGVASLYASSPLGIAEPQPDYINTAIRVRSALSPQEMLAAVMSIEAALGRVRRERWGPRTIDIDLLLYNDCVIAEGDLIVPHPRLTERRFVLDPLAEIASDVIHPVIGSSIGDLSRRPVAFDDDHRTRRLAGPAWVTQAERPAGARA